MFSGLRRTIFGRKGAEAPASSDNTPDRVNQFLAEMQRQAKDSDDRHKAELRTHSERKVSPITDEGRGVIERAQHAHIAIKHVFPPRLPQRSMSYLGGLPIVPGDFDWPTVHNRKGELERLNFVAQIDCADIPAGPARDLLPDSGYLYFFAPLSGSFGPDACHFVTRYEPRKATQKWEPLDMPFTSKIEPEDSRAKAVYGARTHFHRVEIDFGWIEEPNDAEVEARPGEGHAFKVAEIIRSEKMNAFFGPPAVPGHLFSAYHAPTDTLWHPYPGFPATCRTARILHRLAEVYHRKETADVSSRLNALGDDGADDPKAQELRELQMELRVSGSKLFNAFLPGTKGTMRDCDAPSGEAKQQISSFLDDIRTNGMSSKDRDPNHHELRRAINSWIEFAAIHGAEDGLTNPDGAAFLPSEAVSALESRHAVRKHQMLGAGEVVQVAADDMKDRYILLLQLARDPVVDWARGEMGPLQYWITPEDLAARRFENTVLTIEAY